MSALRPYARLAGVRLINSGGGFRAECHLNHPGDGAVVRVMRTSRPRRSSAGGTLGAGGVVVDNQAALIQPLRAWRPFSALDEAQGSVRAWLFTVARNIVIDEWRTRRAHAEFAVADVPEVVDDVDHTDQLLLSWVVAEALTRLSPEHRAVLLECYYRGLPVSEAARRLGIPEGTVKSRTHYALRALRLALEEMGVSA